MQQAGLANLLLTIRASQNVHPVFRPAVWAIGLACWLVALALFWAAL